MVRYEYGRRHFRLVDQIVFTYEMIIHGLDSKQAIGIR